uniref:C-type lectin domain-containing protein n=1 Tax=Acrobeloides nanus TaxID=290746 RepID=A0A914EPZ4_9BILA
MVSIGSYEENSVVGGIGMRLEIDVGEANLTDPRENMWLGLYKSDNSWYWANGAPIKYTNWAPGEPGLDNYGVIGFGTDNQFHWYAVDTPNTISICETNPNV